MSLTVNFDGSWDSQTRKEIEDAVRRCIGEPPNNESWAVLLSAGLSGDFCEVQVTTAHQSRSRLFFDDSSKLAKAITEWIGMYPLR
ncbi:MAG TPA: hypothetical protein VEJ38_14860 [Candidatus Acidoferrales bacterium]|nr:hypothetical protein [Candidatus Acidoferrales bacterium]